METSSSQKCPRVSYLHSSVGFPYGVHRSTDIRAAAEPCLRGHPADMESQSSASPLPVHSNQALLHISGGLSGASTYRETSPAAIACRVTCCSYERPLQCRATTEEEALMSTFPVETRQALEQPGNSSQPIHYQNRDRAESKCPHP